MDFIDSIRKSPYTKYIVGGVVIVVSIPVIKRIIFGRRKVDISKYPRDKVILFQIPRGPHAPNLSPFPLKLETYLRMAKIPYQNEIGYVMSSKNKTPWMVYDGEEVADSHFCIKHLNRVRGVDLNSWLTEDQRAVARAFQMMTEDHLYWVLAICRWCYGMDEPEGKDFLKKIFPGGTLRIAHWVRSRVSAMAHAQGMGRHTKEEVLTLGEGDVRAISTFLGKKAFLMGDQPCEEDCALFGMLAQLYWHLPGPLEKLVKGECSNLGDYCDRMKDRFWPDWDECITHGGTKTATK